MALEGSAMNVTTALSTATELFNWVISTITGNAILTAAFVVATLIPIGIGVFRHLKNAV